MPDPLPRWAAAALEAVADGNYVFPLMAKHVIPVRWGAEATRAPSKVERWAEQFPTATGYGIALRADQYVFDADNHEAVAWCRERLPETREVITGRTGGGVHFYFHVPHGRRLRMLNTRLAAAVGAPPGLDGKTKGGYVVGPGSVHASGLSYAVVMGGPARPAALPGRIMKRIGDRPELTGEIHDAGLSPDEVAHYAANAPWGAALRREAIGEMSTIRHKLTHYLRTSDDMWADMFLSSANRLGLYVASGALDYDEAVGFFDRIFAAEDSWGVPGNVPRSIRRGVAHGARTEAASWL